MARGNIAPRRCRPARQRRDLGRPVRHRRRLGRPFGRGRRGRFRPLRRAHREAQDGRGLPQLRLRALQGADRRRQARPRHAHGRPFGIAPVEPRVDMRAVHHHIREVIAAIAPNDSVERFTGLGVRVVLAAARFVDRRTVVAGEHRIKARRFVIATGSSPVVPPIPGLAEMPCFTNETIFDNAEPIGHLIVVGGGPIGLEIAQAYRRLGAGVTVIEALKALGKDDPELAQRRAAASARRGHRHSRGHQGRACGGRARQDPRARFRRRPQRGGGGHARACRDRAQAQYLRSRARRGAHRLRQGRDQGWSRPRHLEPQGVRDRRRHRRPAVHARRQRPRRHRDTPRPVPPPRRNRHAARAVGDVHRSRAGPRRPERGRTRANATSR